MTASKKVAEIDQKTKSAGEIPLDPFAVDFFGITHKSAEIVLPNVKLPTKTRKQSDWAKSLPKMTNREVEISYSLQNLPEKLSKKCVEIVTKTLARYTFREPKQIKFSVISISEINLNESIKKFANSSKVFLNLNAQPDNSNGVIVLNNEFASSLIDLILGGKGTDSVYLQNLSPIETSIFRFLTLNVLQEINQFLEAPAIVLQNISNSLSPSFRANERGAEIIGQIVIDGFSGIISLIAPNSFLRSLNKTDNPLFVQNPEKKKFSRFEKIIPKLDLRLQIGTTFLDANSLLFLEKDDIVLLEKPEVAWQNGTFTDKLQVSVGRSKNFRLSGNIIKESSDEQIICKIGEILSEESRRKFTPARIKMDEKELTEDTNTETEEQNNKEEASEAEVSASLENIQVALRVELAGNKLSLRELQNLHIGQIIALGCRPSDPVRLLTDNNDEPIASGELIEIEGQLGVRLTKVFV